MISKDLTPLQLSPMSKSFPTDAQQRKTPLEKTVSKTDERKPSLRSANTIKRKAVPLDLSDTLEPIPELPFNSSNRSTSPDYSTSSDSSSSIDIPTPNSSSLALPIQSSEIDSLHDALLPTVAVTPPSPETFPEDDEDANFVVVYAMGGEDQHFEDLTAKSNQ